MTRSLFDLKPLSIGSLGTSKKAKKRQLTYAQKIFAWENKSHNCYICGKRVTKFSEAEFDHVRAYSKSGATNLSNVKIVHRACNRIKGKKTLGETKKLLGIKGRKGSKRKRRSKRKSSNMFDIKLPRYLRLS